MSDSYRKPSLAPLLATLNSIRSSSRPNDDISADIADLIGLDDIELVMEILENRTLVEAEVSQCYGHYCPRYNPASKSPSSCNMSRITTVSICLQPRH